MSIGPLDGRVVSPRTGLPLDVLELAGRRVECIVGLYPSEGASPQPLEVSLALHLETSPRTDDEGLAQSVDYARLDGEIRFLLESCRFRTLETAAHAIARYVLAPPTPDAPHAQVQAVDVRLTKPHALGNDTAGAPTLHLRRFAASEPIPQEQKPWGVVDVIHEQSAGGIYRLRVAPGGTIPTHLHRRMDEAELILGAGLLLQGEPMRPGSAIRWPREFAHRYDNPSPIEQTILCVDRPRFAPDDEIEVDAALVLPPFDRYYPREDGASR